MEPRRDLIAPERMKIRGARILMHPLRAEDVTGRYVAWLNDAKVSEYSDRRFHGPYTLEDAVAYTRSMRQDEMLLGVFLPDRGHVGNVKIGPIDWGNEAAEIAIMIGDTGVWNKGVGTEAMYVAARFLFRSLGLHRADAGSFNPAFLRVAIEKLGWSIEGRQRERIRVDDRYLDFLWIGLLASEFVVRPEFEPKQ